MTKSAGACLLVMGLATLANADLQGNNVGLDTTKPQRFLRFNLAEIGVGPSLDLNYPFPPGYHPDIP